MVKNRQVALVAAVALAVPVLGGCSSDAGYCNQLDEAEAAFQDLRDTNILAEGVNTLQERYDTFEQEADALIDAAGDEFTEETAAVEASLQQVNATIQSAANLDLGTAAQQIGPALDSLATSSQELFAAVTTACE
jgi:outer membrane murein-binding lipoprotein Lpp